MKYTFLSLFLAVTCFAQTANGISEKLVALPSHAAGEKFAGTEKSGVSITLPKYTYKKFEPIELMFEWINIKDKNDSIWRIFNSPNCISYSIRKEDGSYLETKKMMEHCSGMRRPEYILEPGDTIKRSMTINDAGEYYSNSKDGWYFWNTAYFPVGKYKLIASIDKDIGIYDTPLKTNEVEFEVIDNDSEDMEVLELVRQRKYEAALKLYPSNYYREYLMHSIVHKYYGQYYGSISKSKSSPDSLTFILKYNDFFESYPNSLYNLHYVFISHYFSVNCKDPAKVEEKKRELLNKYPGTLLVYTINDMVKRNRLVNCFNMK